MEKHKIKIKNLSRLEEKTSEPEDNQIEARRDKTWKI